MRHSVGYNWVHSFKRMRGVRGVGRGVPVAQCDQMLTLKFLLKNGTTLASFYLFSSFKYLQLIVHLKLADYFNVGPLVLEETTHHLNHNHYPMCQLLSFQTFYIPLAH